MTATVYTQAEVDELLATVKAGAASIPGIAGPVGPVGPAGPAGANIVLSKTAPVNAPDGTIWVAIP